MKYKRAKQCALAFLVGTTLVTTGTWNPIHAQETTQTIPTDLVKTENVEINEINFPDEAFRNYIKKTLFRDATKTELTPSKLERVTEISIPDNKQIQSLKGIAYFTNLTTLNCVYSGVMTLDVSGNTKLTYLSCGSTGITELNVRNNTELTDLSCSSTKIDTLNVRNNANLAYLKCDSTGITELDVSNNTALANLDCSSTGIETLDVSNNIALTDLNCSSTKIKTLDVSKNTALESLYCNSTGITTLNVSNNTMLNTLYCMRTGIVSLDLSNNLLLTRVELSKSSRSIAITSDRVSLQSIDPNLDGTRISNLKNATLSADKQFFENIALGLPITYDYDCQNTASTISMHVSLIHVHENAWITPLKIENWTYGEEVKQPFASAKYGTPSYLYSDSKDGTFTEVVPTTLGTWYIKAIVEEAAAYTGLQSEVVVFTILPKQLTDKSITSTDVKSESDELVIKDGSTTLVLDRDYIVQTQETKGTVTLTITGIGNYQGTVVKSYTKNSSIPPVDDKNTPTNDKKPTSPQTGDTLNIIPYIGFMALSVCITCIVRKKKNIKE